MENTSLDSARSILKDTVYATIATVGVDGAPWAAPMFTVYDPENQVVYWCAARDSQHGQNIGQDNRVFIACYDSMAAPGEGKGVYLKAIAVEVTDPQAIATAHAMLVAKHQAPYWSLGDLGASSPVALYQAKVKEAWVNQDRQENGHFVIYRESIKL